MNLKRQLLLVSLLTLILPWAGCEFIRETESALRSGQQQMLAGTARALANTMAQYGEEFPQADPSFDSGDQLYVHELDTQPTIDGYFDDWPLQTAALKSMRGADGPVQFVLGTFGESTIFTLRSAIATSFTQARKVSCSTTARATPIASG